MDREDIKEMMRKNPETNKIDDIVFGDFTLKSPGLINVILGRPNYGKTRLLRYICEKMKIDETVVSLFSDSKVVPGNIGETFDGPSQVKDICIRFIRDGLVPMAPDLTGLFMENDNLMAWGIMMNRESYKISDHGSTINRIVHICHLFNMAKDGVLVIDEFDNGFHPSFLKRVTGLVYELASTLNVRVFLVSNQKILNNAFVCDENYEPTEWIDRVSFHTIFNSRETGKLKSHTDTGPRLGYLIDIGDIDLLGDSI